MRPLASTPSNICKERVFSQVATFLPSLPVFQGVLPLFAHSLRIPWAISILTSIVALILREPLLGATDLEAQAIAVPAANLFAKSKLNEKFGRYIASSGDYQLLGYALWVYFSRVTDVIRAKNAQRQPVNRQQYTPPIQQNGHTPQPSPAPAMPLNPGYKGPPGVQRYG